ncbi:MAG: protein kinase [Proteobacteria bacterium]|nr:protein kinase [Pseudomonadota bacterium]
MNGKSTRNSLLPGYKLHWYEIKSVLGQGGFGITYLATDLNLHRDVAIKEYLPIELAVREDDSSVHPVSETQSHQYNWGLERFITEARILAKFRHPNIVLVQAVFEENNTGYIIMQYEHGQSLRQKLEDKKTMEECDAIYGITMEESGVSQLISVDFKKFDSAKTQPQETAASEPPEEPDAKEAVA